MRNSHVDQQYNPEDAGVFDVTRDDAEEIISMIPAKPRHDAAEAKHPVEEKRSADVLQFRPKSAEVRGGDPFNGNETSSDAKLTVGDARRAVEIVDALNRAVENVDLDGYAKAAEDIPEMQTRHGKISGIDIADGVRRISEKLKIGDTENVERLLELLPPSVRSSVEKIIKPRILELMKKDILSAP